MAKWVSVYETSDRLETCFCFFKYLRKNFSGYPNVFNYSRDIRISIQRSVLFLFFLIIMNKKEAISVSRVEIVSFIAHYSCLSFLFSSGACLLGVLTKENSNNLWYYTIFLVNAYLYSKVAINLTIKIPSLAKGCWVAVHRIVYLNYYCTGGL